MRNLPSLSLLPLFLLACPGPDPIDKTDTGGGGYHETGEVVDTADTAETGGDTAVDTAETGADTAETGDTGVEPGLAMLQAWPATMVVNPGATWNIRVIGTQNDKSKAVYVGATFTADDATIVSVDGAGMVTALAEGATTIRVTAEGKEVDLSVTVRAAFEAHVRVTDASTGAPIEGATVRTAVTDVLTDAAGEATVPVVDGGPATITTWYDNHHYALSILDTVNRELTLPLKVWAEQTPTGELHGAVDFTGIPDAGIGEETFGLASSTVQGALPLFEVDDLLAPDRTLNYHGVEADVPSNIFVEGYLDDYYALCWPGSVGAWGLGGPVAIADLAAGLNGTGDAMALVIDHLDTMTWGSTGGYTATAGVDTEAPLAPSISFSDTVRVALPSLSAGFDGSEEEFVATFDGTADGWMLTGLGLGSGVVDVKKVPAGSVPGATESSVFVMAQVGGLGSGGGTAVATGVDEGGTVTIGKLQDIPTISWVPSTQALDTTVDPSATLVHIVFDDTRRRVHEVWTDGSWSGTIDKQNPNFERSRAFVTVESFDVFEGTFEGWVSSGDWQPEDLDPTSVSRASYAP